MTGLGSINVGSSGKFTGAFTGSAVVKGDIKAAGGDIALSTTGGSFVSAGGKIAAKNVAISAADSIGASTPLAVEGAATVTLAAGGQALNAALLADPLALNVSYGTATGGSITSSTSRVQRDGDLFITARGASAADPVRFDLAVTVKDANLVSGGINARGHTLSLITGQRIRNAVGTTIQGDTVNLRADDGTVNPGSTAIFAAGVVVDAETLSASADGDLLITEVNDVTVDGITSAGFVDLTVGGDLQSVGNGVRATTSITARATGASALLSGLFDSSIIALETTGALDADLKNVATRAALAVGPSGSLVARLDTQPDRLSLNVPRIGNLVSVSSAGQVFVRSSVAGVIETPVEYPTDLAITSSGDLQLGSVRARRDLTLVAPAGDLRSDASLDATFLSLSARDGIHSNPLSDAGAVRTRTGSLELVVSGPGNASVINTGPLSLFQALAPGGDLAIVTSGDLTISGASSVPLVMGSTGGSIRLVSTCGSLTEQSSGSAVLSGRRVELSAAASIRGAVVSASCEATFRVGSGSVLDAVLLNRPEVLRIDQSVAGNALSLNGVGVNITAAPGGPIAAEAPGSTGELAFEAARGDLIFENVNARGREVKITASQGSVASAPGTSISGGQARLIADRGVGAPAGEFAVRVGTVVSEISVTTRNGGAEIVSHAGFATALSASQVDGNLSLSTGSDLRLAGEVTAQGVVHLAAGGSLTDSVPTPGRALIRGARVELIGGAGIGTAARPLMTEVDALDARGGAGGVFVSNARSFRADATADATADTSVFLQARAGDLTVGTVNAGLTAELIAAGKIVDGNGAAENVTLGAAGNLRLRAGSGIGSLADPLETAAAAVDAATTSGDIALSDLDHLQVKAAAPRGDVAITARGGYLILDTIVAAGRVSLVAPIGGVLDANGTALNVTARELLIALCDTAGTAADFLEVAVRSLDAQAFGAFVDAQGALEVTRLQATGNSSILASGDLALGRLESTKGALALAAAGGSVTDANGGAANVVSASNALSTIVATGTIGAGNAIEVSLAPGFLSVLAGDARGGVSVELDGEITPAGAVTVLGAPGSVLFRNRVQGTGTSDQGQATRTDPSQSLGDAVKPDKGKKVGQSDGKGNDKPQKANELIDASAVQAQGE